jgi:hypothetical protein
MPDGDSMPGGLLLPARVWIGDCSGGAAAPLQRTPCTAKDHGSSVKNDKQYEGLKKKGTSKERAAKIADTSNASQKGGKRAAVRRGIRSAVHRPWGRRGA